MGGFEFKSVQMFGGFVFVSGSFQMSGDSYLDVFGADKRKGACLSVVSVTANASVHETGLTNAFSGDILSPTLSLSTSNYFQCLQAAKITFHLF